MNLNRAIWLMILLSSIATAQAQSIRAVTEDSRYAHIIDGKVAGPATAVVEATLKEAGLEYQLSLYPWARAYDLAQQQPNVLIYLIARTPEREAQFKWVGEVIDYQFSFYKMRSRQDIQVNSIEDAKRYLIGVVRDDVRHSYLMSKGFTKLALASQNLDSMRRLVNGQIELLPLIEADARRLSVEVGKQFSDLERVATLEVGSGGLYLAYSLATDDAIVERTRQAFARIRDSGQLQRLMNAPVE
ncbi:Polar amino acid transport system substrate-binding protein [Pseudomonas sp. 8Z]|uniref:substrate-binding periplasmic protein n=1 Tax=Pseudomonas sp. 8Z TaxID=2653166 RepID=UPI0012F11C14|nr:transporter substrate-binding domain-containing protein [Pseudomonas sp. 8Z]VXC80311.1 Polar amino acid transport system substrate-binding protein [Pseudomonas sp. 8Z]